MKKRQRQSEIGSQAKRENQKWFTLFCEVESGFDRFGGDVFGGLVIPFGGTTFSLASFCGFRSASDQSPATFRM